MPRTTALSLDNSAPASRERGRAYFLWVSSLVLGLLTLWALFNYLVNPMVNFRDHRGLGRMVNQRQIKVDLLRVAQPRPEVLILGSSRVRNLDPGEVGQTFGMPAFNAGVQNGCPRDWFAFARYAALDLHCPLHVVMVGVDPDSFLRDTVGPNHPAFVAELRRQLPHPWWEWLVSRKQLWDPAQTKKSWEILVRRFEGAAPGAMGSEIRQIFRDLLDPPHQAEEVMTRPNGYSPESDFGGAKKITWFLTQAFTQNAISPEAGQYWNALAALASERRFVLVAFIIPMHPELENRLEQAGAPLRERRDQTRKILLDARARGVIVCEIDPATLNFDDYTDLYHPGPQSSRAMIQQVYACAQAAGKI